MLALRQQRCERTAWLMGAADVLWERAGQRLGGTAIMEELHQQTVKAAQEALGEDGYAALFRDGAGRPLDLVVTIVVTDADELPATPGRQRPAGLLTGRERQIATLVGEGMSNRDIAQRLGISKRTVDAHLEHIFGKAGHLLACPARHRAQSDGAVPRLAAASARAAWALTRRPIHQNSTPTTMKHSTGVSSVHR